MIKLVGTDGKRFYSWEGSEFLKILTRDTKPAHIITALCDLLDICPCHAPALTVQ